jgi:hypothetical protein
MKSLTSLLLLMVLTIPAVGQRAKSGTHSKNYSSAEQKFNQIQSDANGGKAQTTTLTADEISAYVNEGGVTLPVGVENVKFSGRSGTVTAVTRVDFDKITAGKSSMNPLMMLFSGQHDVTVTADAQGSQGRATVNVQTVEIDGVTVPRAALEFFVSRYLQPKYGNSVGLNNNFAMPSHVDSAVIGNNTLTLTQK